MEQLLVQGTDFYYNGDGYLVFTESYLLTRGYCCGNGCLHCPYQYINVPEPARTELLAKKGNRNKQH